MVLAVLVRVLNPRASAAQVLFQVLSEKRSLDSVLPKALATVKDKDQSLVQELCYGTLRWHDRLEALRLTLLKKPQRREDPLVQALVRVGFYQLLYLRVPAHAAVSETVQACRALSRTWATGFVNGLLRGLARRQESLLAEVDVLEHARYSHPTFWLEQIRQAWPQDWQAILTANNQRPPLSLRVNRLRVSREDYGQRLRSAGVAFRCCSQAPDGLILTESRDVEHIPGFADGLVSVQDSGAQMAVDLLAAQPGMRVLDACAAPGGKSCHILERQPNLKQLVAMDVDGRRLARVAENRNRLGVTMTLCEGDARKIDWWDGQPFDRIIVDAPCSSLGVIRRHPEIKQLRQRADILRLSAIQQRILKNLWPLLKTGGILLYSTCSILPEENEQVIATFLENNPQARQLATRPPWAKGEGACWQILPGENDMDGFFYARLEKRA